MCVEKYLGYLKTLSGDTDIEKIEKWINSNLNNYLKNKEENQGEIEHILDYLASKQSPKRISRMSYPEVKSNTEKWVKALVKKASKIEELESDIEVIKDFGDGFKIVKLVGKNAFEREGSLMTHCVASYYGRDTNIYSLRDKNNNPHCTIEGGRQIKGKGNGSISPKYVAYIVSFLEQMGMTVGDQEMKNLGYFNAEKIKDHLHMKTKYFNEKYVYEDDRLIGEDGKEFFSLDLLDVKPLIKETSTSLKINFDLPLFVEGAVELIEKSFTIGDDHTKNASSEFFAKNASSGNHAKNASSGDYAKNASSGDHTKNASSGDFVQNASSGDLIQNASSGDLIQNASSGDLIQNASSGDFVQNASSGDHTKNASLGDFVQNASSGDHTKNASSGDAAKNASSGSYSSDTVTGKKSVCASIGRGSRIKAVKGSWITLAEYDENGDVLCVKSGQIDGEILNENTWYHLKNGEFTETE